MSSLPYSRIPKQWRERTAQHQPLNISTLSPDQSTRLCRSVACPAEFTGKTRTPQVESPVVPTPQVQILSTALSKYISNQLATAIPQCPTKTKPAHNISYLWYRSLITGLVACPKTDSFSYGSHNSLLKTDRSVCLYLKLSFSFPKCLR